MEIQLWKDAAYGSVIQNGSVVICYGWSAGRAHGEIGRQNVLKHFPKKIGAIQAAVGERFPH